MNPDLIPTYDMLGSPTPFWLAQLLMALTLALHWAFLGAAVGGTLIALIGVVRGDRDIARGLSSYLPFFLSMAMTMGVAPLLFVQVLYGQFFYTSTILLGFWWLGLPALVIVNFYIFWWGWHRLRRDKSVPWLVLAAALVLFVKVGLVLSSNATLVQTPTAWEGILAKGMNRLYLGGPSLVPRLIFALSGLVGAGGLAVAVLSQAGLLYEGETQAKAKALGLGLAVPALATSAVFGLITALVLPGGQRGAVFAGGFEAVFTYLAAAAMAGAVVLAFKAKAAESLKAVALPGLVYFVALFLLAFVRDHARRAALAPYFKLSSVPVHPEWANLVLFLVTFVAGLGVIAYLVKLARTPPATG